MAYSAGEGAIRAIAAWSTGEVFPVPPIKVIQLIHRGRIHEEQRGKLFLNPPVVRDENGRAIMSGETKP